MSITIHGKIHLDIIYKININQIKILGQIVRKNYFQHYLSKQTEKTRNHSLYDNDKYRW